MNPFDEIWYCEYGLEQMSHAELSTQKLRSPMPSDHQRRLPSNASTSRRQLRCSCSFCFLPLSRGCEVLSLIPPGAGEKVSTNNLPVSRK